MNNEDIWNEPVYVQEKKFDFRTINITKKNIKKMNDYFDLYTIQPRITKYEYARLIGIRAKQIAKGSPINVERYPHNEQHITCPLVIAEKEMNAREIPLTVQRKSETINPNLAKLPF